MKFPRHLSFAAKAALFISIMAMSGLFYSCSKGDTGPPGPEGPQGTTGMNGSANIISSTYIVTTTIVSKDTESSWTPVGSPTYHWVAGFIDTSITISSLDVVLAYWSTGYGADWNALPAAPLINNGDNMNYRYNNDSISFTYYTGGAPYTKYPGYPATSPVFGTILFKVIIVPPGLAVNHPEVNWKNASQAAALPEVQAALNKHP
jgi:hypothetical protein